MIAFGFNPKHIQEVKKGRADARPFLIVYPRYYQLDGGQDMNENDKPEKAWWINWLIIVGTIVVIAILGQG